MRAIDANGITLHVQLSGDPDGAPVVFANSLGTDLRLWDALLPHLPEGLRFIRFDTRGHGLSSCPDGPYAMDDLASDAAALIDALDCGPVTFIGLSIGGMIGQSVASRRPDLIRALVLSNTAAKIANATFWRERIAVIAESGLPAMNATILDRWFGPRFRATPDAALWGTMLSRTPQAGYLGCCAAIAAADLTATTGALRLPTLAIAGSHDGSTTPDLVAATAALIPDAAFHVIAGTGHLPCIEDPVAYAAILSPFLKEYAFA